MSNTARRHHHLSQFYLAGFTPLGTKDDLLAVIDKGDGRTFRTKPKNVAHQHDFNRIDMDGIAPDALETELSKIETTVADVLRGLHHDAPFEEDVKNVLLNWMSFLSVRSPQWRHFWNGLRMMHAGQVMPEVLASEEAWEANKRKVKENGGQSIDLDFDTMKQLHHEYGTDVRPTREWLIKS